MAKFEDVFDDTQTLFTSLLLNANLAQVVTVKLLTDNKQKDIYKVVKANDLVRHMTDNDVVIILNENIFDQLPEDQKKIIAEEAIASISFDFENDKLALAKPDLTTFSGIISKYSLEKYLETKELIRLLYSQEKDKKTDNNTTE